MSVPTFDADPPKREKINLFKIRKVWCFKHFFDDKEIFEELYDYYNQEKYRFELSTVGERNKIMKYLYRNGFDPILIEDAYDYTVTMDRVKKYAPILRNSIDYEEEGEVRIFIMKDLVSVEEAVDAGAEKCEES